MYNLQNNTERILKFIQGNPGMHLRQIKKELQLSLGTIQYHLTLLEKSGRIVSERRYFRRTYFPVGTFEKNEKSILKILKRGNLKTILLFIMEKKNPTQTDIANGVDLSNSTVNWHLKYMLENKIIYEIRDGKFKRYQVWDGKTIIKLMKDYHPSLWNNWNHRIIGMFLTLWYYVALESYNSLDSLSAILEL